MTDHQFEPAPEGFEFDEARLEAAGAAALRDADPDIHREITEGRVAWVAEVLGGHVMVTVMDKATGAPLGTLELPWPDVCRLDGGD